MASIVIRLWPLLLCIFVLALEVQAVSQPGVRHAVENRAAVPAGYVAKDYYPTPKGGWIDSWKTSYAKAQAVVSNMTLAEKVNVTSGTGIYMGRCVGTTGSAMRFGYATLCLMDAALGIRDTQNNSAFPAGITTGATFDKNLMYQRGVAIGAEFRGKGANVHLGPTVGPLGRKPRGGRGWEGFGADPVLQGIGASQHITGVQSQGVIATVKHLIGNEQEEYREQEPLQPELSANIDDRTLHELYLWPFADAVRAGVGAVMSSYNDINGSQAAQNSYLINGLLKDELGFQGFIMCDWLSQDSGVATAIAGLDMAMPGDQQIPLLGLTYWAYELSTAVLNGSMPLQRLDDMATRVLATWYQLGQDQGFPEPNFSAYSSSATGPYYPGALTSPQGVINEFVNVQGDHEELCRSIARDAITMLKNDDNTLPLSKNASLRLFGTDQAQNPSGPNACSDRGCDTGTLGMGWGSGTANYPFLSDPLTAIEAITPYTKSYNTDSYPLFGVDTTNGSIAIVFLSADSGENYITVENNPGDRTSSGLNAWHNGDALVQAAASHFSTVIVVVHTVGPILMEAWIDLPQVKSVLVAHLPGQEAGYSLTDILFGDYSPSGHLPYSIPKQESDYPTSTQPIEGPPLFQIQDTFTEGLYIDYRYLTKHNVSARFLFGYGLSYTTFTYGNASVMQLATLSPTPAARSPKGSTPSYATTLPDPSEAAYPNNLTRLDRFLYPYLDDPNAVPRPKNNLSGPASGSGYPYPPGYPTDPNFTQPDPPAGGGLGGNPALFETIFTVNLTVTNSGNYSGKAAPQLYVQYPSGAVDVPPYQLRDFAKTDTIVPGQTVSVGLELSRKDLSYWDVVSQNWLALQGEYVFWIGEGVGDLRVSCSSSGACASVVA